MRRLISLLAALALTLTGAAFIASPAMASTDSYNCEVGDIPIIAVARLCFYANNNAWNEVQPFKTVFPAQSWAADNPRNVCITSRPGHPTQPMLGNTSYIANYTLSPWEVWSSVDCGGIDHAIIFADSSGDMDTHWNDNIHSIMRKAATGKAPAGPSVYKTYVLLH